MPKGFLATPSPGPAPPTSVTWSTVPVNKNWSGCYRTARSTPPFTDPAAAPNFRAAALKQLAPQAQDAFQVRSELVPEPPRYPDNHPNPLLRGRFQESIDWPALSAAELAFTDQLGGDIRTLTVYTVLGKSRSGILSSWPAGMDSFVVVAVPRKPEPARPQVLRAAWQPPLDIPVAPPRPVPRAPSCSSSSRRQKAPRSPPMKCTAPSIQPRAATTA